MSYLASVYRVMIASPSDVIEERNIIREVISKWNNINSKKTGIVLLPVGWETHISPETGDKPQEIINKRILNDCDLLVGVFWTKVGTPTAKYEGGTIEEIEEHIKSGKPAMIYFSNAKIDAATFDKEQYEKLKKYKKSCTDHSIYKEYDDIVDFKDKFYEHLQIKVNEHEYFVKDSNTGAIAFSEINHPVVTNLSNEAKILLLEAVKDPNGFILSLAHSRGASIRTNGKEFIEKDEPREIAKWEGAIDELENDGLIRAQGYKRQSFKVTNEGYKIADLLNSNEN